RIQGQHLNGFLRQAEILTDQVVPQDTDLLARKPDAHRRTRHPQVGDVPETGQRLSTFPSQPVTVRAEEDRGQGAVKTFLWFQWLPAGNVPAPDRALGAAIAGQR